jgi:uncharacterized protein (UPF0305 family)
MNASDLLTRIRHDMDDVSGYIAEIERARRSSDGGSAATLRYLGDYNYTAYREILELDGITPDFEIDPLSVEEFERTLNRYLDIHALGREDLKTYIVGISLYLTFIAQRPLHPPGVPFSEEIRVIQKGGFFYCSGKRRFLNDPVSCCRFCVCRPG